MTLPSLSTAAWQIERQELSPLELTQACLERIEACNPTLNCFLTVTAEEALRSAGEAEDEIQAGRYRGPLHGIPLGLKDLFETRGVRTTAGSKFFENWIPDRDAVVVERLKRAGAVLLGKLNMHEIALGVTNQNPHFGDCRNPWDTERITGGSSGGNAAAVAAGMCLGALGSDTGGSIRIPSSLCGTVGLKPTYGRVSLRGVLPLAWSLDTVGPMARSVRDAALLLEAIAGYDPQDPASVDWPAGGYLTNLEAGVNDWRVGLACGEYVEKSDAQVLAAVQAAAGVFERLGARVEPVELPEVLRAAQTNGVLVTAEAAAFHQERLQTHPQVFGADVRTRLERGSAFSGQEISLARRTQVELRRKFELFFQKYDLLLLPATPSTAPLRAGEDAVEAAGQLTRFTAPFNLTGLPALALPCGFSREGLPIGLEIAAGPWKEAALLRAGFAYEQATGWLERRPPACN